MRDKRPVDELSIEELERILAIRKREARMDRLRSYEGRRLKAGPIGRTPPPILNRPPESDDGTPPEQVAPGLAPVPIREAAPPPQATPASAPPSPEYYQGAPQFEDELDARRAGKPPQPGRSNFIVWWNRALMLVEIAAVLGLIVLIIGLFQSFRQVEQTTAQIQAQAQATALAAQVAPTATPIINIATLVLPTGHTFQNGQATVNLDEVPAQYRDQFVAFSSQLPVTRLTPVPEAPIRIRIPRIGVDSAVVYGDSFEALKQGVGQHIGSANPGQRGNMVLSAHNDIYGEIFRHLDQMQPGDEVIVSTATRDYTYIVQAQTDRGQTRGYLLVRPTDTWVLNATGDVKKLTLISCYPYRVNSQRIVVFATLRE